MELRGDWTFKVIWIRRDREETRRRIKENFLKRINSGFIKEAEFLKKHFQDLEWSESKIKERFLKFGLAYKFIFDYWEGKISLEKFIELGILEEQKYAKRQETFIKKFFNNLPDSIEKEVIKK
jgi:tRNA A37 N6-isopentenylltransferase MiaA